MAHFAKISTDGTVITVLAGRDEDNEVELSERTGELYKQTSYNTIGGVHYDPISGKVSKDQSKSFRKNFAVIGGVYDSMIDAFIPPKPFNSWVLDTETCLWHSSIQKPSDGFEYKWNEDTLSWEIIPD